MKFLLMVASALLVCSTAAAQSQRGVPSRARLAEMGLADMQILSDQEAQTIRVHGRPPTRWSDLYTYVHGLSRLDRQPRRTAPLRVFFR